MFVDVLLNLIRWFIIQAVQQVMAMTRRATKDTSAPLEDVPESERESYVTFSLICMAMKIKYFFSFVYVLFPCSYSVYRRGLDERKQRKAERFFILAAVCTNVYATDMLL